MPQYAFNIQINSVARTVADSEAQAREYLADLDDDFEIDYTTGHEPGDGQVRITAASLSHDIQQARLFEPEPEPVPTIPLYQAGVGDYEAAFAPARAQGWTRYTDASGNNHTDVSPDGQLSVEFGPEADAPRVAPLWRIAYRNPDPYRTRDSFTAYFDGHVPAEAIAAFLTALTAPSPGTNNENEQR